DHILLYRLSAMRGACIRRVAGCATPTGSAGHAGATASLKLTFHLDHSVGANQSYLLDDFDVDPETKCVLGVALEKTRVSLGLADDFANGIIAKRLIELAKAGERNPDLLCEGAIEKLRGHLYGD